MSGTFLSYERTSDQSSAPISARGRPDYGESFRVSGSLLIHAVALRGIPPRRFNDGVRGEVKSFSAGSSARMRRYLRECVAEYSSMLTLTYPSGYPHDGRIVKEHLRRFNQELLRYASRRDNITLNHRASMRSIFWFLEFQNRGAPHFHLFISEFIVDRDSIEWCAKTWFRIVGSDDDRHLRAGTRLEKLRNGRKGTVSYAAKYAAKAEQKVVPENMLNAGRFWGVCGCRSTLSADAWVSSRHSGKLGVETAKKMLATTVKKAVCEGKMMRYKGTRDGIALWVITDMAVKARVFLQIRAIQAAVAAEDSVKHALMYSNWMFQEADLTRG